MNPLTALARHHLLAARGIEADLDVEAAARKARIR